MSDTYELAEKIIKQREEIADLKAELAEIKERAGQKAILAYIDDYILDNYDPDDTTLLSEAIHDSIVKEGKNGY